MDMTTVQIIGWGASLFALGISLASVIFSIILSRHTNKNLKEIHSITNILKFYVERFLDRQHVHIDKLIDKIPELQENVAKDVVKEFGKELDEVERKISDAATMSTLTFIADANKLYSNLLDFCVLEGGTTKNDPFNIGFPKKKGEKNKGKYEPEK